MSHQEGLNYKGCNYHHGGWRFRYRGKWVPVPREIQGKQAASQWKEAWKGKSVKVLPSRSTLLDVGEAMIAYWTPRRSAKTIANDRGNLDVYLAPLHRRRIQDIDKTMIMREVVDPMTSGKARVNGDAPLSGPTIHGVMMTLSKIFEYAIENELTDVNPVRRIKAGKGNDRPGRKRIKKIPRLTPEQFALLVKTQEKTSRDLAVLWAMLGLAGLRIGEGMNMRWEFIDWERNLIYPHGTKNEASAEGKVTLSPVLRAILLEHRNLRGGEGYIVLSQKHGAPYSRAGAGIALHRLVERVREVDPTLPEITPHILRHMFISGLMQVFSLREGGVARVQGQARHSSPLITLGAYTHDSEDTEMGATIDAQFATHLG